MPTGIDACDATTHWPSRTRFFEQRFHLACAHWERAIQDLSVTKEGSLVLLARKNEEPGDDTAWGPSSLAGQASGDPFVPADLAFDRTEIIDDGLDLDDQ
jgi:hypothetical protein